MTVYVGPQKGCTLQLDAGGRILIGLSWDPKDIENKFDPGNPEFLPENAGVSQTVIQTIKDLPEATFDIFKMAGKKNEQDKKNFWWHFKTGWLWRYLTHGGKQLDGPGREKDFPDLDLDVSCYVFNQNGEFEIEIGPGAYEASDDLGSVYHSGDDSSGYGGPDDEQIFINTQDIPESYAHFFVVVTSDCQYSLDETNDPFLRIALSKGDTNFFMQSIKPAANLDAYACVCAHLFRDSDYWYVRNITDFVAFETDWKSQLSKYIERKAA